MNKNHIGASLCTCLLALAPFGLHAETDCCIPDYQPSTPLCDDACGVYPAFGGIELDCGWNLFTYGEFLYWKPNRFTSLVVATSEPNPAGGTIQKEFHEKWGLRSGFRVGIGTSLHCFDHWIGTIDYTRYHHNFSTNFSSAAPTTLAPTRGGIPAIFIYNRIRNTSTFNIDTVDMKVQRPAYLGQSVVYNLGFGLSWLRRYQDIGQDLTLAANGLLDNQNCFMKYDAIGPAAKIDGSWLLCWGFRLIGKVDLALVYAYKTKVSQVVSRVGQRVATTTVTEKHLLPLTRGGIALGWGDYFCCNRYHLDLSVGFDLFHEASKVSATPLSLMLGSGTTLLYGLAVRGQFDF
ncbi:MAG: hypothetical protein JSS30_01480 [Verrucomicrobia bacterium]|nr:hypothetical protein [Verrucomicrobiota bacterium]